MAFGGPLFVGALVRPNMLNMPKSASGFQQMFFTLRDQTDKNDWEVTIVA